MTVEEMRARAVSLDDDAASSTDALQSAVFDLAAEQWRMHAALCERLGAQNKLLERIAGALEASEMNTRRNTL